MELARLREAGVEEPVVHESGGQRTAARQLLKLLERYDRSTVELFAVQLRHRINYPWRC
jgi:hypothetical protein